VKIEFDEEKRARTLAERGLDFVDVARMFAAPHLTFDDDRFDYGEHRLITFGTVNGRAVAVVWTERGGNCRVISMRHAHAEEIGSRKRGLA
jgi:uncharacterized protein